MLSRDEVEASFEAVPAYIVADRRYKFGHYLGQAAFVLLVLFFVISSYVQSARNGEQLDEARKQRADLVQSQLRVTETLHAQGELIVALQQVITRQNAALRKAGLPLEPVPNLQQLIDRATNRRDPNSSRPTTISSPSTTRSPQPVVSSSPSSNPKPKQSPKPRPRPSPKPSPRPTSNPVTQLVCNLTGICASK